MVKGDKKSIAGSVLSQSSSGSYEKRDNRSGQFMEVRSASKSPTTLLADDEPKISLKPELLEKYGNQKRPVSDVEAKWGEEVAGRGFAQIPNYLLLLNQFLDEDAQLTAIELLVLIQIVSLWWNKGDRPYPSLTTLAIRCGVSDRQVQRAVTRLEAVNLLKREKRRQSGMISNNAYDLSPLVTVLERVAKAYPNAYPRQIKAKNSTLKRSGKVSLGG